MVLWLKVEVTMNQKHKDTIHSFIHCLNMCSKQQRLLLEREEMVALLGETSALKEWPYDIIFIMLHTVIKPFIFGTACSLHMPVWL